MKLESNEGFLIYYNLILLSSNGLANTALPKARTAIKTADGWIFQDEAGNFLTYVRDSVVLSILKLETVGPGDANKPH